MTSAKAALKEDEAMISSSPVFETKFDIALNKAGSWGSWQRLMLLIISASQIFSALHSVAAVFLSSSFDHRCSLAVNSGNERVINVMENITYPDGSKCTIFNHNYSAIESFLMRNPELAVTREALTPFLSDEHVSCDTWHYRSDYQVTSAVSEWDLVCSRKLLSSTVQATFMAGILLGSVMFGQISDRIGRRKTMLICVVSLLVLSISVAFVTSYLAFIFLRFLVATLCAGLMVTNFVLLMEITKPEARSFTGMINGIPFGLGVSLVACFAYFIREWRMLQLALGIFGGVLLVYFWILPESPRWLVTKGRPEEALTILKTIARWNKRQLPPDEDMMLYLTEITDEKETGKNESLGNRCSEVMKDQITLIRTPVMRKRVLIGFFAWFVSAMVYYGLIFSASNINANPYLMVLISGLIEVPSFLGAAFFLHKFGRRLVSCSLFIICSIFLLLIIPIPDDMVVVSFVLANVGKFFNTAVFQLCYLYTSELMPTGVRNLAVGTSSMVARIGSSTAPYIVDGLGEIHYSLPSTVFGALSLAAGLLTLLLPETLNKTLPQTVEEVEANKK